MKISTLRNLFHAQLSHLYIDREIDSIFYIYIEYKYKIRKHQYLLNLDYEIEYKEDDIDALAQGCPIQYVTGTAHFFNLCLDVNSSVLIPRQETEELVAMIIHNTNLEYSSEGKGVQILDLCTGSGAIAIALAKNMSKVEAWATDVSENALKIAEKNAVANNANITFLLHDILHDSTSILPENVDIIVSNPPYIPSSEQKIMHKNVINYEPKLALFVPDESPLVFYRSIADVAKKILRKGGTLYFETHEKFHFELTALLTENGFKEIELWNDINGKPRFARCKKL